MEPTARRPRCGDLDSARLPASRSTRRALWTRPACSLSAIGSLVVLDTNELAVVLKPAADQADAEHPIVKVITDPTGTPIDNGRELDLREKDDTGNYRHSIVRLIDNTEHQFDTGRYFV